MVHQQNSFISDHFHRVHGVRRTNPSALQLHLHIQTNHVEQFVEEDRQLGNTDHERQHQPEQHVFIRFAAKSNAPEELQSKHERKQQAQLFEDNRRPSGDK